jgi:SagB-type dehydrogenase family enzyme
MALNEALERRRSRREFGPRRLRGEELSQLLWSAQGTTASWGGRTAPSAGGLYPLELYVLTHEGVWRYESHHHAVRLVTHRDRRSELARAAFGQAAVKDAAAVFAIVGVYERTAEKYGPRAERYTKLEAGHVAQNLLLAAAALELAAVPVGAFDDEQVASTLELAEDEDVLYLVAVGQSAASA